MTDALSLLFLAAAPILLALAYIRWRKRKFSRWASRRIMHVRRFI